MKNLRVCVVGVFQRGANWNARGVPDKSTGRIAKEYSGARGRAEPRELFIDWRRNKVRAYIDCHRIFRLLMIKLIPWGWKRLRTEIGGSPGLCPLRGIGIARDGNFSGIKSNSRRDGDCLALPEAAVAGANII